MKFDVKRGDLTVDARFQAPAFALLRPDGLRAVELLLTQLAPYGATAETVFYNRDGALGNQNVTINTPRINGGVKVFVSKVEAGFNDLAALQFADIRGVAKALFDCIAAVSPATRYAGYVVSLNYHGIVEGMSHADFVRQFTPKVPDLGPVNSTAAGFYYGRKDARDFLSVVLDGSVSFAGAVFMRITAGFDGGKISSAELPSAGADMLAEVLAAFRLEHDLDLGK